MNNIENHKWLKVVTNIIYKYIYIYILLADEILSASVFGLFFSPNDCSSNLVCSYSADTGFYKFLLNCIVWFTQITQTCYGDGHLFFVHDMERIGLRV